MRPTCIAFAANCSSLLAIRGQSKLSAGHRSCAPSKRQILGTPCRHQTCPPKRIEARKLLAPIYDWSPKASTLRSSKMQRRCLTN